MILGFNFHFRIAKSDSEIVMTAITSVAQMFQPNGFNRVKKDEIEASDFLACCICGPFTPSEWQG